MAQQWLARDRIVRLLDQAEGFLMLDLPERALGILTSRPDWATMPFEAGLLMGEALRALGRHREAIPPLETAHKLRPGDLGAAVALGWCYKRTHRLAQAIDALETAARKHPAEPLLRYNLACYWSLAQNPARALDELATALSLDPEFRARIAAEPDFQALRGHPEFERLAEGAAA